MNTLILDLRYALRGLARSPGFAVTAVLSLALGIGANAAMFSVISALLLQPLPYQDADRLAILWNTSPGLNITHDWFSTAQYFDIRNGHHGFEQLAIAIGANVNLTGDGEPERVGVIRVSSNLLPMLGTGAAAGRLFLPEEDSPGRPATAVIFHGMWIRRFGGNPGVIGRSIILNGQPFQIAGVLARDFSLPQEVLPTLYGAEQPEILLPLPLPAGAAEARGHEDYNLIGKLRRGVSVEQARAEMATITARLRRDHPDVYPPNGRLTFEVIPLLEQVVGDVRRSLLILMGSVGFVLLIAGANVANLLLSRALARQKEIAVRAALGASRARIIRQLLTESVLLALCGGLVGVLLSSWSIAAIRILGPKSVPRLEDIGVDYRVLLVTLALSLLSGILFGLAPALRVSAVDPHANLKDAGRGMSGAGALWGRGNNLRKLLVMAELALSVMLLIGAGLLVRSFARLQRVPPGFNPGNVLTLELTMSGRKYGDAKAVLETYRQLWDRLERLPGVTAAGGVSALPLSQMFSWGPITVEGRIPPAGEGFLNADKRVVAGDYFRAMEIPLRKGRWFNEHDTPTSPHVAIIDEFMAEQLWPNQDPLGKRISSGDLASKVDWLIIVGVVGRVKQDALDSNPRIACYFPHTQFPTRAMNVVMRGSADPASLTSPVQKEIHSLDAELPIYNIRTMEQRVSESLARRRFSMLLLGLFASLALALAAIGAYGVMAYLVSQGTHEIGIRLALGATERGVVGLVVRRGLTLAFFGVAAGLGGAFVLTRFLRGLLFEVDSTDPLTFTAVAALIGVVALIASYAPARRASRADPMTLLRVV